MIGRHNNPPPRELLDYRSEPDTRMVLEDLRLSNGERTTRLGVAHWIFIRRSADADAADADDAADDAADADDDDVADADDDADADAADDAADADDDDVADDDDDADADAADADADAADDDDDDDDAKHKASNLLAILTGDIDVKEGLKIIQVPGRYYYKVTKVGWLRRASGDEFELVNACTIIRTSGSRHLDQLASDGPQKDHRVFEPARMPEDIHRLSILRCLQADPEAWPQCPRPKDWAGKTVS
jgi:hypothetical protein